VPAIRGRLRIRCLRPTRRGGRPGV